MEYSALRTQDSLSGKVDSHTQIDHSPHDMNVGHSADIITVVRSMSFGFFKGRACRPVLGSSNGDVYLLRIELSVDIRDHMEKVISENSRNKSRHTLIKVSSTGFRPK